ncbi:serine/threonine-protein kinase LMTK1 isoform X1 [Nerophis ophidion]|uniref:serine/threonine-protein kinase LMTK1 isoform X1 n=2 Tax=Nerophis ophidion TaxID=159077 RepID=UPI002AE053CD|nr:serine/threonine-protein kinase LMTK1 isoform X1 [Nerophis ophidion]
MRFALHVTVMSSAFFNPSSAFSSHFDTDGAPLSELSWPSSLAVVVVSFSGLFTFVFVMLACLCCKKGDMGFKEFENADGEEYQADLSPSRHNGPEVYILPLTEVSLPVSKQPGRSIQLLKSSDLSRHSLLYLKEIGHGWFGKVLLGEVNVGLSTTQVVVKELKASASVQDQMQFLEEVQPFRTLQHPALLQCLAQCSEVTPYLLVMEFCPLGDLKSYLCGCRVTDSETPDPLILQRMACDIASGLLHLHNNNFIHSDLALRNCLLTSEMSVKIGDYGLSHSLYKEDYYFTQDQIWVPLRWIAPELIDEVHGNLLIVNQTKSSNIWSLGVTMWELFEFGEQPYRQYSDRQVLTYAVREQQLKLAKPQIHLPLAERWYEVMQFCWLQPELRPSSEEVHLLLTYLCAKSSSEVEEDFEERWNALRPNLLGSPPHTAAPLVLTPTLAAAEARIQTQTQAAEPASSASSSFPLLKHFSDSFHSDTGDDLLTVTETSHGLNFEYKWEQGRAEHPYCSSSTSGPLCQGNPHYQDVYYSSDASCRTELSSVSSSYYEPEHPCVVPVLSALSPSVSSEYYIRIEETSECNLNLDDNTVDCSPALKCGNTRLSPETQTPTTQSNAYWSTADSTKSTAYDSDSSPTLQLTMDPLIRQAYSSPVMLRQSRACTSSFLVDADYNVDHPHHLFEYNVGHPVECSESQSSLTQAISSPSLGLCDPYLENRSGSISAVGSLQKTLPIGNHISIDIETGDGLLVGCQRGRNINDGAFFEEEATNWTSNHSANNNILSFSKRNTSRMENYLDLQYNTTELWCLTKDTTKTFRSCKTSKLEAGEGESACTSTSQPKELGSYIHLCHQDRRTSPEQNNLASLQSNDCIANSSASGNNNNQLILNGERLHSEPKKIPEPSYLQSPSSFKESRIGRIEVLPEKMTGIWEDASIGVPTLRDIGLNYASLEKNKKELGSGIRTRNSTCTLVELGDYSEEDDDFTDITSGIFADFNLDYAEIQEYELSPVKNPERTTDSVDTMNLSSSVASTSDQAFSPDSFSTPAQPKSLDSGYDTENNGSPEFMFKELSDPQRGELVLQVHQGLTSASEVQLKQMTDKHPYRDSAYFSDYENDKSPREDDSKFFPGPTKLAEKLSSYEDVDATKREFNITEDLRQIKRCVLAKPSDLLSTPGLSMLSPFPAQMGGCLTKEAAPENDDLGLDTEHQEEPRSELSNSTGSELSSTVQEASGNCQDESKRSEDCGRMQISCSESTVSDYEDDNETKENTDQTTVDDELPEFNHVETSEERMEGVRMNEEEFEDIDAEECDSLCEEPTVAAELSSSSSMLELCGEALRAPLEEAEDEDDSEDSESDEELRTYSIQAEEDSEGSDEDLSTVPVVVSDSSRARHLRGLLKMPTLLTQSFCDKLERKKKAVSFFDDVTVFLFDQESPTGELVDFNFSDEAEYSMKEPLDENTFQLETPLSTCETQSDAEDQDDAEEGHKWEEDLAFEKPPPDSTPETEPTLASPSNSPEVVKSATVAMNRFMVSRFSITHVSDTVTATGTGDDSPKD